MKRLIYLFLVNLTIGLIQTSFTLYLVGPENNPNLVLAFGYAVLAVFGRDAAILSVFMGGLALDFFGSGIYGTSAFILCVFVYILAFVKSRASKHYLYDVLFVGLAALFYNIILSYPNIYLSPKALVSSLSTVVVSAIFIRLIKLLHSNV